jgi:hypothetical protein
LLLASEWASTSTDVKVTEGALGKVHFAARPGHSRRAYGGLVAAAVAAVAVTVARTINDAGAGAAMAGVPGGSTAKQTSAT